MSIIQKAIILKAIENFKVAAKGGGEGRFVMKGLNVKVNNNHVQMAQIELVYNFDINKANMEDAEMSASYKYSVSLKVGGLHMMNESKHVVEIEELELAGIADIENFFMSLPISDLF